MHSRSDPMSKYLLFAILALASVSAACERRESAEPPGDAPAEDIDRGPDENVGITPAEDVDRVPADSAMERTTECANNDDGYAIEYPAGWQVNTGEILSPCALFDPDPIEVPRNSEIPIEIAIMINVEPVPFATLTGDVMGRRNLARELTTVDGRNAMRVDGETTGEGLYDAGIRSYQYFVDLGDTTMVASTYDVGATPFERKRRILDDMMATLDFRRSD